MDMNTSQAARSRGGGPKTRLGFALGLIAALAVAIPVWTYAQGAESGDGVREAALAAGCDMSQNEVAINETEIFYEADGGAASVEEAVLRLSGTLKADGLSYSDAELKAAAEQAEKSSDPIEVTLPGASIQVVEMNGQYFVDRLVTCG